MNDLFNNDQPADGVKCFFSGAGIGFNNSKRLLADASAVGYSLHDVLQYLKALESRNAKERP